jgi:hypothetical protein
MFCRTTWTALPAAARRITDRRPRRRHHKQAEQTRCDVEDNGWLIYLALHVKVLRRAISTPASILDVVANSPAINTCFFVSPHARTSLCLAALEWIGSGRPGLRGAHMASPLAVAAAATDLPGKRLCNASAPGRFGLLRRWSSLLHGIIGCNQVNNELPLLRPPDALQQGVVAHVSRGHCLA